MNKATADFSVVALCFYTFAGRGSLAVRLMNLRFDAILFGGRALQIILAKAFNERWSPKGKLRHCGLTLAAPHSDNC